jgi:uncharacterized protein
MLKKEMIKLEVNVPITMRDGTILYADVWRPETAGKYPAILTRTPYNKNLQFPIRAGYMNPQRLARAGYAVVIQDVRGTGDSEGRAFFWKQEVEDGYDSVEGIAALPWCDGNIGMFGFSYFGWTQWAAAVAQPPHLKAICPGMTYHIPHSFPFSPKGDTFKLQIHLGWCLGQTMGALMRRNLPPEEFFPKLKEIVMLMDSIKDQVRVLPLKDAPAIKIIDEMGMNPQFAGVLAHSAGDDFWKDVGGPLPLEKMNVPVFHIAGWYDTEMTPGVIDSYRKIAEKKGAKPVKQKMLIGPWIHSGEMMNLVGQLDFGLMSSGALADLTGMHIKWFDRWLKGIDNSVGEEAPVRLFIMGDNRWRDENEWPLARTRYTKWYFHSAGQANTRSGDGALDANSPADEPYDSFLYDPRNPAPSNEMGMGAFDQQLIENRPDILVYSSPPLEKDLEVTGPVHIKLFASTSAVDTDFTGKLVDVWPSGAAYNVAEGIIRARYRRSTLKEESLKPGEVYEYDIDLGVTGNVFKTGHRMRVEISSSNFPKWERNLNTGHTMGEDADSKIAAQIIYHNSHHASHIELPIIPG